VALTASAIFLRVLARAIEGTPVDLRGILAEVGLSPEVLDDDEARVPLEEARHAWNLAGECSGDEVFGLNAAERVGPTTFELIEYLGRTASNVGQALENVARYTRLVTDAADIEVEHDGDELHFRDRSPGAPRHFGEFFLALIVRRLRELGLADDALVRVAFLHSRPRSTRAHDAFFRAPVAFDHSANLLVFRSTAAWHVLPTADETLRSVLERHAREVLDRAPEPTDDVALRVQRIVEEDLAANRTIDIDHVAKRMAISRRTLQRRLAEQSTSFNGVLDRARHQTAIRLARKGIAASSIAFIAGFADVSAFHRAFKRWTGLTPAKFASSQRVSASDSSPTK